MLVAAILAGSSSIAAGGECVDRPEDYVATLEAGPSTEGFEYAVSCLGSNPIVEGRLWAGPNAAATFAALRADTLRPRLTRALSALLETSWAGNAERRRMLYAIAARRGIAMLESVDVFTQLVPPQVPVDQDTYQAMAILGDCRSVGVLVARRDALRAGGPGQYPDEVLDVLSSLYHIPCKDAIVAARRMILRERNPTVRDRLNRIIERR